MTLELNLFDGEASAPQGAENSLPAVDAQPQTKGDADISPMPDKGEEFDKLIKGEFKEQFDKRIKENLRRRFKESSSLKAKASQSDEIINLLSAKYGISNQNLSQIAEAIKNDDSFLRSEAEKQGIEPDTLKKIKELEFENENMKRQIERGLMERKLNSTVNSWIKDSKELTKTYPDFDLSKEAENKGFLNLLRSGVDLKTAYYATHHEDIVKSMVKKASEEASVKITDSIRARGTRPNENGISNKSTAILKTDVSRLTPKERAEIAKRVMQGEEISF